MSNDVFNSHLCITVRSADFDSLIDEETREFFKGTGGHFYGDWLLVQVLKELRALRAEVAELRVAQFPRDGQ